MYALLEQLTLQAAFPLPGGFGTLDELFEIATLVQTGKVKGFPIVLAGVEYWRPMLDFLRQTMVKTGTIDAADVDRIIVSDSPEEIAQLIHDVGKNTFGLTYGVWKPRWWLSVPAMITRVPSTSTRQWIASCKAVCW